MEIFLHSCNSSLNTTQNFKIGVVPQYLWDHPQHAMIWRQWDHHIRVLFLNKNNFQMAPQLTEQIVNIEKNKSKLVNE